MLLKSNLKDLTQSKTNKCKKYEIFRIDELPENVSGGSLRTGSLNEMDIRGISPHRMAAVSGQFLQSISAMWEYILVTAMTCLPGVMALAGWSRVAVNDGLYRKPVIVPSIQPILDMDHMMTCTKIDNLMNNTLRLDLNCTPLLIGSNGKGGRLRMFAETMFATEVILECCQIIKSNTKTVCARSGGLPCYKPTYDCRLIRI